METERTGGSDPGKRPGYQCILVPLDGSVLAEQAIPQARLLAEAFGSRITLLRATRPVQEIAIQLTPLDMPLACDVQEIRQIEDEQTAQYLQRVAEELTGSGLTVEFTHREGHPADVIHDVAKEIGADLIVITTHGHGGWRRLIFGSVASETVRHSHCPVLLVHVGDSQRR